MSDCCKTGFKSEGQPEGKETKLANLDAYVTGSNKDAAVLLVHDIFGWTLPNLRTLADHYAKEANVTVYLPDFFGGEVVSPEPEIFAAAKALKQELGFKKVGAIGFCYSGWAVFRLGAKGNDLVDCISTAHPSALEKAEVDAVAVPTQILAPEEDPLYTPELKEYTNRVIPSLGVEYDYQYFPGLAHGFATRGDMNNEKQKQGLERTKNAVVHWFQQHLHPHEL